MNASELADWIKDTEFYDNPNPEINDKMDEVEAMLRKQQAEIKELKAGLVDKTEKMQGCAVDKTQFLQGSVDLDDLEDKDSYEFSFHEVKAALAMLRQQQARIKELEKCTTAYAGFDPHENHEWDRGDWTVGQTESQEFIESSDFNHDVRLYLNGDFEDDTQRLNYLQHIADRLNTHPVELTDEEITEVLYKWDKNGGTTKDSSMVNFARAILRKASEK